GDGDAEAAAATNETKTADIAAAIIGAVAAPAPAPPNAPVAGLATDPAGIGPVEIQAAVPIIPAGGTTPEAPTDPAPAPASTTGAEGTVPVVSPPAEDAAPDTGEKAARGDENQSAPVPKAAGLSEPDETKPASP